ncbi:unnamed protein product [Didymodactylos carnosus]|uniref:Uncharacterized protein n=1 Tax=Didymodactylos carnosus TaxID=1234261 RepID=A0A8S2DA99_9BILA|nr:unnamed protein product [Didymodactylos carnosus]CAF3668029.1 unnamed protein product [Didymodactylos carnosus]
MDSFLEQQQETFTYICGDDSSDYNFVVVWLDNTESEEYFNKRAELRDIIRHIFLFCSIQKCNEYISSYAIDHIFLVIAGTYANEFDKIAEEFQQLSSDVHHYVLTKRKVECFNCVRDSALLVEKLHVDYELSVRKDSTAKKDVIGESIRILNTKEIKLKCLQSLIDIFRKMAAPPEECRKKITEHCKQYCANRPIDLKLFKDFDTTYCKERAIEWYTRNCFLNPLITLHFVQTILI